MKKRLFLALFLPLFTLLLLFTLVNQPVSGHQSRGYYNRILGIGEDIGTSNPDWMAELNDNLKLSELSIPGTHDTMAVYSVPVAELFIRTQSMKLRQQLDAGIRVLDMRPKNTGNEFLMYHGLAPLYRSEVVVPEAPPPVLEFNEDVLTPIREFLYEHPGEAIFMEVAAATDGEGSNFEDVFLDYMEVYTMAGGKLWNPFDVPITHMNNPTLGEVRGKLVILESFGGRRWGLDPVDFTGYGEYELVTKTEVYTKWDIGVNTAKVDVKHNLRAADGSTTAAIYKTDLNGTTKGPNCSDLECWERFIRERNAVLVHPAFVASGHSFPFLNESPREWTGTTTQDCDDCFSLNPLDPRFPKKCDQNIGNCFEDWPPRTCYFGQIVKLIDFPDPIPDIYGPTIVSRQCIYYEGTNVLTMNYINTGKVTNKVGIIRADYPGPGLIEAIIGLNKPDIPVPPVLGELKLVPDPAEEGSSFRVKVPFSDHNGGNGYTCTVNYFDGNGPQDGEIEGNTCIGPPIMFADDGEYQVFIQVKDNTNLTGSRQFDVPVRNVPPAVEAGDDQMVNEGVMVSLAPATFTDPGILDTHKATVDWGDGTGDVPPGLTEPSGGVDGTVVGSHIYADNGEYGVQVCVKDNFDYGAGHPDLGWGCDGLSVNVSNVPPTVYTPTVALEPSDEGWPVSARATFSDPGGAYDLDYKCTIDYGDGGTDEIVIGLNQNLDLCDFTSSQHTYADNGNYQVTVFVEDKDGGIGQKSITHIVNNVAPTVDAPTVSPEPSDEGSPATATATFSDPGGANDAPYTCTVNYGDGSGPQPGTVAGNTCTGPAHVYADNGLYSVGVVVTDKDGGVGPSNPTFHLVNNVPPMVDPPTVNPEPSEEGSSAIASATFSDPGVNDAPYSCTVNYGDNSGPQAGTVAGNTCTGPGHTYVDNGDYLVNVIVTDKDGGTGQNNSTHTVINVPPIVDAPTISPEPSDEGSSATASATFSDPGINDAPYSCTIDYGDGSGSQGGTINGYTCTGPSHTYADNGVYEVSVSVTDKDDATGQNSSNHTVNNVAPTATFANTTPPDIFQGESATLAFSNVFDPGPVDTSVGFTYSYDCTNDGPFEQSGGAATFDCPYPDHGTFTARGRIEDKDGGFNDYTVEIIVLSPQEAAQTIIDKIQRDLCEAGVLNKGQCNSLTAKLENAIKSLDNGNSKPATNQVEALINEVNGYMNGGNLTSEQGQEIIDLANRLIASIGD